MFEFEKTSLKTWVKTFGEREWAKTLASTAIYRKFLDNGYEMMDTIAMMTNEKLIKIGINKIGHRDTILLYINKLKQSTDFESNNKQTQPQKERKDKQNVNQKQTKNNTIPNSSTTNTQQTKLTSIPITEIPKPPRSAMNLFRTDQYKRYQRQHPDKTHNQIWALLRQSWGKNGSNTTKTMD